MLPLRWDHRLSWSLSLSIQAIEHALELLCLLMSLLLLYSRYLPCPTTQGQHSLLHEVHGAACIRKVWRRTINNFVFRRFVEALSSRHLFLHTWIDFRDAYHFVYTLLRLQLNDASDWFFQFSLLNFQFQLFSVWLKWLLLVVWDAEIIVGEIKTKSGSLVLAYWAHTELLMAWEATRSFELVAVNERLSVIKRFAHRRLARSCLLSISIEGPFTQSYDFLALSVVGLMKKGWLASGGLDGWCLLTSAGDAFNLMFWATRCTNLGLTLLADHISDDYSQTLNLLTARGQLPLILFLHIFEPILHLDVLAQVMLYVLLLDLQLLFRNLHLWFKHLDPRQCLTLLSL